MRPKVLVIHHRDADGFGASFAVWTALKDSHEITFVDAQYGEAPPEMIGQIPYEHVFILDFSYKRDTMLDLIAKVPEGTIVCLDHHKTAQADLEGLPGCVFDLTKSGCRMAWELFFDSEPPHILQYVEDRDLWKFELEMSKEVNAYIALLAWDFAEWRDFSLEDAMFSGKAVIAFQKRQIESRVKAAELVDFGPLNTGDGYMFGVNTIPLVDADEIIQVPCVNASENISELGEALCHAYPEAPFSMSYCDREGGLRSYSLRSRNGFDVSEVARAFGGGGHPAAAGFTLPSPAVI